MIEKCTQVFEKFALLEYSGLSFKCKLSNFYWNAISTFTPGPFQFFHPWGWSVSKILISPSSACFRGDGWHDHGCGHGRGRQLGHQDNNSMHRRNWTRVMDDPCKTFWNTLEMFSHFLSWERDKSAWHNPSQKHPKWPILGVLGGTENGTWGAQIKILRPLFNTNTPPKTPI